MTEKKKTYLFWLKTILNASANAYSCQKVKCVLLIDAK